MKSNLSKCGATAGQGSSSLAAPLTSLILVLLGFACQSTPQLSPLPVVDVEALMDDSLRLAAGDVLQITFPGAPNLDTTQKIRVDGKITLPLSGDLDALGKTPAELQQDILAAYDTQLQVKVVTVAVQSLGFPVYVAGAVQRQGKLLSERPITALEAVMEAGGFDPARAKMSEVTVIRTHKDRVERFTINLKAVLDGKVTEPFYLEPNDIVFVPQKRVIF